MCTILYLNMAKVFLSALSSESARKAQKCSISTFGFMTEKLCLHNVLNMYLLRFIQQKWVMQMYRKTTSTLQRGLHKGKLYIFREISCNFFFFLRFKSKPNMAFQHFCSIKPINTSCDLYFLLIAWTKERLCNLEHLKSHLVHLLIDQNPARTTKPHFTILKITLSVFFVNNMPLFY